MKRHLVTSACRLQLAGARCPIECSRGRLSSTGDSRLRVHVGPRRWRLCAASVCMRVVGLVCETVHRWHFLLLCGDDCRKGVAWASVPVVGVCVCVVRSFLSLGCILRRCEYNFFTCNNINLQNQITNHYSQNPSTSNTQKPSKHLIHPSPPTPPQNPHHLYTPSPFTSPKPSKHLQQLTSLKSTLI